MPRKGTPPTKRRSPAEPGRLVHELEQAIETQRGVDVAVKLDDVIKAEAWKAFRRPYERTERRFDDFGAFVSDQKGLSLTPDQLRFFCSRTPRILSDLDALIKKSQRPGARTDLVDNIHKVERPSGTSRQRALRRLREQRPDLHDRVVAGELTPHAAMIEAGFRHKTATVPIDDVEAIAAFLRRKLTKAKIRKLIEILAE